MIDSTRFNCNTDVYLQWMKSDIKAQDLANSKNGVTAGTDDIIPFEAPEAGSTRHRIQLFLYKQLRTYIGMTSEPKILRRWIEGHWNIGMPKSSLEFYQAPCRQCCWTLLVKTMAGHSKWQNIRHIKAAKDKQKSDLSFKFSQRIRLLIKETGESNPKFSNKLDRLIQEAKKAGVPNSTIQNAIEGAIASQTASEHYYLEVKCFGPIVLILVISSPTIIRTKSELSTIFRKNKVKLEPRCSEGMFEKKGVIHVTPTEGFDLANALDLAIEVDAEDVFQESEEDGSPYLKFHCEAKNITSVTSCLKKLDHDVTYSECEYLPTAVYRYRRIDRFCTGKELTLLPKKLYRKCGAAVSINDVHIPPTVQFRFSQSPRYRRYILIMTDPDMHFIEKYHTYSHTTDHLHWMKLNFSVERLAEGVTSESSDLYPYTAPGPSLADRRIQFLLYEQKSDNVILPYPTGTGERYIDINQSKQHIHLYSFSANYINQEDFEVTLNFDEAIFIKIPFTNDTIVNKL
ncbi:Hypothetical predicted protein [Octopus vulgaris]|uniref:Uncharacterized protein n=1 Tax=Octopus vulgaris TaxID=6645 RepID=A0AA36B3E5_OCTVU|nr:Hypothetical predicted protein [Octopus vulgaris]